MIFLLHCFEKLIFEVRKDGHQTRLGDDSLLWTWRRNLPLRKRGTRTEQ
jgi:hypothetical protein